MLPPIDGKKPAKEASLDRAPDNGGGRTTLMKVLGGAPSRRTYIPKADGRQRPLGIAGLEDKIVQSAVVAIHRLSTPLTFKAMEACRWFGAHS
jgi:hypothetical protein